jgi:hypothetical protein
LNLPPVDPNNYGGTVHFGPSVSNNAGQYSSGVNYPNPNFGYGGGANIYPGI